MQFKDNSYLSGRKFAVEENKGLLLGMIERGEKRPKSWEKLGGALINYMRASSVTYDEQFKKEMLELDLKFNRNWFKINNKR